MADTKTAATQRGVESLYQELHCAATEVLIRPAGEFYVVVNRDAFESLRRIVAGESP